MSLRLKNENSTFPPGGLQFEERQLGWKNWINDPNTVWSWDGLVAAILKLRRSNAGRFPKLSQDPAVIRRQISEQNARRISGMAGAETYLREGGPTGGPAANPTSAPLANSQPSVVEQLDKLARGAASLLDWWVKEQGTPVPAEQSATRAFICTECPKNNQEDLGNWFTKQASEWIRKKLEARKDLKLETPHDEKLGVCEACSCPLKLAVHQPLDIKLRHLSPESKAALWSACWVRVEEQPHD